MIINGGSRSNAQFFEQHLSNGEENERVTLCEMRNLASDTIAGGFMEMRAIAMGTICKNYFYHANINPNPPAGETLSEAQWTRAVGVLEAPQLVEVHHSEVEDPGNGQESHRDH